MSAYGINAIFSQSKHPRKRGGESSVNVRALPTVKTSCASRSAGSFDLFFASAHKKYSSSVFFAARLAFTAKSTLPRILVQSNFLKKSRATFCFISSSGRPLYFLHLYPPFMSWWFCERSPILRLFAREYATFGKANAK